jgi:hypothetical protein
MTTKSGETKHPERGRRCTSSVERRKLVGVATSDCTTKANKKQAKHTRHACLKDWAKPHTTMAHVQRTNALKFYTISELNIDAANGSKPNHQARAVDIAKCFPQIVLGAKDEGTLVENLLKKFGR